jgi:hypothetical protein
LFDLEYCAAFGPNHFVTPGSGTEPLLVTVTDCATLLVPTGWLPKDNEVGDTV